MARITAIVSGKGGVGKSTLSAGIGAALARRGERVLLIDCDAGLRSQDVLLGVTERLVFDISDVAAGRCTPEQAIYRCASCPGLSMIAAPLGEPLTPAACRAITLAAAQHYDRVLMDAPAGVGEGFFTAVAPAASAIVVATPDAVSVRSGNVVREALAQKGITETRLIINRFSAARFLRAGSFTDLDAFVDRAGVQLLGIVPEDAAVPLMAARGIPMLSKGNCSEAFERIAARLCGERVPLPSLERT